MAGLHLKRDLGVSVILAALTVAAYERVWSLGFVNYDDPSYVTDNEHVLGGVGWSAIVWAFTTTTEANWHPITWLSLMLDASICGGEPRVYHATNLLLHVVNTLLLFLLLRRTTASPGRSAFVAALFAVHPLHVESVAWVSERKDVLSTTFWMLTVLAYLRYVSSPSGGRYAAVVAAFALGLATKPMLVTLPITLLLLDYWPLGRWKDETLATAIRLALEKGLLLVLAVGSAVVTLVVQRPAMEVLEAVPFGVRAANALVSAVAYVGTMLWPHDLAALYPYPRAGVPLWRVAAAASILVAGSLVTIRARRRRPWLAVGWLFYLVTLVPVSGLVQVGYQARADRYTYVPLIGLFIVAVWGIADVVEWVARRMPADASGTRPGRAGARRRARGANAAKDEAAGSSILAAVGIVVVVGLAMRTWHQVGYWRSSIDLWGRTLEVTESNAHAHYNLATAYRDRGDADRAVVHLREALATDPRMMEAHFNLTRLLMKQGKLDEAEALVREEQRFWPSHPHTFVDLGVLAVLQGREDEAIAWFSEALRLDPDLPDARHNLDALTSGGQRGSERASPTR